MERRIYKINETCNRLKCGEHELRQKLTEELANELTTTKDISFKQLDSDTLQVELSKQGEG